MSISPRRFMRAAASMLPLVVLASCGGGGGGGSMMPATATIGGTVSGLVGTVILQNNAGDNLSVTANGGFTFATPIMKGSGYAVTVFQQPSGPSCSVANGSGTATDTVSNVSVTCTTDPLTVYVPWIAFPAANTSGGVTGLVVASTKNPGNSPIQVMKERTEYVASLHQSNGSPYAAFYTTFHTDGSNHLWSLNLTGNSTLVPTQVSSLTFPYYTYSIGGQLGQHFFCSATPIAKNVNDPASAFLILSVPTNPATNCLAESSSLKWLLVHPSDSASTDPVTLTIVGPVSPLYGNNGTLAGLVATDSGNHLNFYADETFTNPTQLLTNVTNVHYWGAPLPTGTGPTFAYLTVLPAGTDPHSSAGGSVYKVDSSGALSADLYDFKGANSYGLTVADQDHVYFLDSNSSSSVAVPTAIMVGQIAQGVAQTLYTFAGSDPFFLGYAGQHLIFMQSTGSGATLQSLAVGSPGTPATIGTYGTLADVRLVADDLLVTQGGTTEILAAAGTVLRPQLAGSGFISSTNPALMANHIADSNSLMGAEIDVLDLSQPTFGGTPLKNPSGATYTFPASAVDADLHQLTAKVGIGLFRLSTDGTQIALEYDLSSGVITPITLANTSLSFAGF